MQKQKIQQRVFLVGCPRSGTTLLQSLLAAHPNITSFPESQFFIYLFSTYEPKRKRLGLSSRQVKPRLEKFLRESHASEMSYLLPKLPLPTVLYTSVFVRLLDRMAQQENATLWIEKTPDHLHYIDYIEKQIRGVKFIHIIRNGIDVVASLYDVRKQYPKEWHVEPANVDLCLQRWLKDVNLSLKYHRAANHLLIRYEDLVEKTEAVLTQICHFMGVDYCPEMIDGYKTAAQRVALSREPWKQAVGQEIKNQNSTKFYTLFDQAQREYIQQRVSDVNLQSVFEERV